MKNILFTLMTLSPLFAAHADLRCSDVVSTSGDAVRLVDTHSEAGAEVNSTIGFSTPAGKRLGLLVCNQLLKEISCSEGEFKLELSGANKGELNVIQFSSVPGNKSYEFKNQSNGEKFESHRKCEAVRAKLISSGITSYRDQALAETTLKSLTNVNKPTHCQL